MLRRSARWACQAEAIPRSDHAAALCRRQRPLPHTCGGVSSSTVTPPRRNTSGRPAGGEHSRAPGAGPNHRQDHFRFDLLIQHLETRCCLSQRVGVSTVEAGGLLLDNVIPPRFLSVPEGTADPRHTSGTCCHSARRAIPGL